MFARKKKTLIHNTNRFILLNNCDAILIFKTKILSMMSNELFFLFFWIICRMNFLYMDGWDGYLSHKSWEVPLNKLKAILYTISMWYKTFVCMIQNTMDFLNIIPNYKIELSERNRQKCFRSLQVFCEIPCIEIHHDWTTKICSKWPSLWLQFKGI